MIFGHVRDHLPRLMLALPGISGDLTVEFIIDTGFDGDLTLPAGLLAQLDAAFSMEQTVRLADGSATRRLVFQVVLDWDDAARLTEVLVMEGAPLLGAVLLEGHHIEIDMADGGEVRIDAL